MPYDMGDKEPAVMRLQEYLRRIENDKNGLPLILTDGIYDKKTADAVRNFQKSEGLPETGEVDRNTWDAIYYEYVRLGSGNGGEYPGINPYSGEKLNRETAGDIVIILKMMLRTLSAYYDGIGEIPEDGRGEYNRETEGAVRDFQSKNGLTPTGEVDGETWQKLSSEYNSTVKGLEG